MATRFRLTEEIEAEDALHATVAAGLHVFLGPGVEWSTFPAGHGQLTKAAASKLVRLGMKRGWPDILLVHAGQIFGIELKTRGGRLSKTRVVRTRRGGPRVLVGQEEMHPRLAAAGMRIAVCRSWPDVVDILRHWEIPVRARTREVAA